MQSILGIDVSKDSLDVALIYEQGQLHKIFSNNLAGYKQLERWLTSHQAGQVHACLEATGQYGDGVAEYLYEQGHLVSV